MFVLREILSFATIILSISGVQGTCLNGPTTRRCWRSGFNIDTNYDNHWPNTGITREYWLSIGNATISPDGVQTRAQIINGSLPGPTLYGDWGDEFVIHVTNNMPDNGTSIHFHGIRQFRTNQFDGVPGVTECAIAPGRSVTYKFQASQYGTGWYHSHWSVQLGAGVQGAILINGPATMNYDIDLGTMTFEDWYHDPPMPGPVGILLGNADDDRLPPTPLPNALINGTNLVPCNPSGGEICTGTGKRWKATVEKGKSYRLRIINTSIENFYRFTIDGHIFWVIQNDFTPVHPYKTNSVVIGIGQRYDVVFHADQEIGNYWLRGLWQDCGWNLTYANETVGIIHYAGADEGEPVTTNPFVDNPEFTYCFGPGYLEHLTPWIEYHPQNPATEEGIEIGLNEELTQYTINGSDLMIDWEHPTALQLAEAMKLPFETNGSYTNADDPSLIANGFELPEKNYNGTQLTAENIIHVPNVGAERWVFYYINRLGGPSLHPMHLHGHQFVILAQGWGPCFPGGENGNCTLNTDNPPRRDVAMLFPGGHLVIGFLTNNPGIWLMHCHIAWHASQGLGWQFLEGLPDILPTYDLERLNDTCKGWTEYVNSGKTLGFGQDDTGL